MVGIGFKKVIFRSPSTARLGSNSGIPGILVTFWEAMKSITSWVAPLKARTCQFGVAGVETSRTGVAKRQETGRLGLTEDDRISRKGDEVGVEFLGSSWLARRSKLRAGGTYVEEVKLLGRAADGVGEKQEVPLQPRNLLWRELEADTWTGRHGG